MEKSNKWLDAAIADAQGEIFGFDRSQASKLMRLLVDGSLPAANWIAQNFQTLEATRAAMVHERDALVAAMNTLREGAPEAVARLEQMCKQIVAADKTLRDFERQSMLETMQYLKVIPGVLTMLMDIADRLDLLRAQETETHAVAAREVSLSDLGEILSSDQMGQVQRWLTQALGDE